MKLSKTFENAIKGIIYCIKNERNMRIHIVVTFYVVLFSFFFDLTYLDKAILACTLSSVIAAEMFNTAIERTVDLIVSDYNSIIKIIKDIAAGAVFVTAAFSVIVGLCLFSKFSAYVRMYQFFIQNPVLLIILFFSLYMSLSFIINGKIKLKIF